MWLGVAYLWTGSDNREKNKELLDCIRSDINEFSKSGQVILVGDINTLMDDLDGYTDYNGSLVLDHCDEQNLIVVNRENKYLPLVTWQCGNRQSGIDYALVSEMVYEQLDQMIIDENGKK